MATHVDAKARSGISKVVVALLVSTVVMTSQVPTGYAGAVMAPRAAGVVPVITSVGPIVAQNGTVSCLTGVCVTGAAVVIDGSGFGSTPPVVAESPNIGGAPIGSSAVGVQAKTKNLEIADVTTGSFMGLAGSPRGFFSANDCYVTIGAWSDTRIIVLLDDTGLARSLNRCSDMTEGHKFSVKVFNTDDLTPSALFDAGAALKLGTTAALTHLSPASGPTTGGTFAAAPASDPAGTITVTGTGLAGASIIWFGNGGSPGAAVAVTDFTLSADASSLTVVPPPSPLGGDRGIFIAVTTAAGTSDVQCNAIIQGCEGTYYYQSTSNVIPTIDGTTGVLNLEANLAKELPINTPGACPSTAPVPGTGVSIAASAKVTGGPVSFKGAPQTSTNLGLLSSVQVPISVTIENPVEISLTITGKIAGCFAVPIPGLNIAGLGGIYVLIGGGLEVGYTLTATLNKGSFLVNVGYVANQLAGVAIPVDSQKCVDSNGAAAPCLQTKSSGFLTGSLFFSPLWIQVNIGVGPASIQAGAGLMVAAVVTISTDTGLDYDVCFGGNYAVKVELGPVKFDKAGTLFGPYNIYGNGLKCPLGPIGAALPVPTVAVASSANPGATGAAVTYTATVTPAPTGGSVSFADNNALLAACQTVPVDKSGKATCSQTYAAVGPHSIVATYSGDAGAAGATSAVLKQEVTISAPPSSVTATTTIVESSSNPAAPDSPVIYSAAVTPVVASGTVSFTDNGDAITTCQAVPVDVAGKATCSQTYTAVGQRSIVATFNGIATHAPSTSAALIQQIIARASAPPVPVVSEFKSVTPERLLDTRPNGPQVGYVGSKPIAGQTITLQVSGAGAANVPTGTVAVVLNVTGTEVSANGFVTVWPCDTPRPNTSNLNLTAGQTVPNLVTVKLSAVGTACIYTQGGAHFLADLAGYFPVGSHFAPTAPERLFDTRPNGPQIGYTGAKPTAGQTVTVQVTGAGATKVPDGTSAVLFNVTGTEATGDGFVTVWPCDAARPTVSNLNLTTGATSPNLVTVKLSATGTVCIYTQSGTHLIADVAGYFPAGVGFTPVVPERLLETRLDRPQVGYSGAKPAAGQTVTLQVTAAGSTKVPVGSSAVILTVTATEASADGFVTVWSCDASRPTVSNLNLVAGATAPNMVIVALSATGKVCLFTQSGTHLLADISGYFAA